MSSELEAFDAAVASLTSPGQPFELNTVTIGGHEYRNFANMQRNLGEYYQVMHAHADKDFAVYLDERYTFAQGYQHSAEFATALLRRYGVSKGDRVAILSRNNPQWMMAFIGTTAVGAVAVAIFFDAILGSIEMKCTQYL